MEAPLSAFLFSGCLAATRSALSSPAPAEFARGAFDSDGICPCSSNKQRDVLRYKHCRHCGFDRQSHTRCRVCWHLGAAGCGSAVQRSEVLDATQDRDPDVLHSAAADCSAAMSVWRGCRTGQTTLDVLSYATWYSATQNDDFEAVLEAFEAWFETKLPASWVAPAAKCPGSIRRPTPPAQYILVSGLNMLIYISIGILLLDVNVARPFPLRDSRANGPMWPQALGFSAAHPVNFCRLVSSSTGDFPGCGWHC